MKLALVISDFNDEVTAPMAERAEQHARALGVDISHRVHVPGVFDMGPVLKKLLARPEVDGVALIGAVIKGETLHDEVITHAVAAIAARLATESGKPVGFGITGPGMTDEQAVARIDNARHAVEAVVRVRRALDEIDRA